MERPNQDIYHIVIRLNKEDSAFTYFMLESHEGLCFFSTLPHEKGQLYRDLDLKTSITLKAELDHLLDQLKLKFPIEILNQEIIGNN